MQVSDKPTKTDIKNVLTMCIEDIEDILNEIDIDKTGGRELYIRLITIRESIELVKENQ